MEAVKQKKTGNRNNNQPAGYDHVEIMMNIFYFWFFKMIQQKNKTDEKLNNFANR